MDLKTPRIPMLLACAGIVSLLAIGHADAAKLYKVVGKDGKVTYSQFPPSQKTDETETVESVSVNDGGATLVSKQGNYEMCGKIRLPRQSSSKSGTSYFVETLDRRLERWQRDLTRYEEMAAERSRRKMQTNNSHRSNSHQTNQDKYYLQAQAKDQKRMRDLRCAVDWAKSTRADLRDTRIAIMDEKGRLSEIKEEFESKIQQNCGELPPYDPTDGNASQRRSDWYQCSKDFRREIRTIESKMRRL